MKKLAAIVSLFVFSLARLALGQNAHDDLLSQDAAGLPAATFTTAQSQISVASDVRPALRPGPLPRTRWQHRENHAKWTRAALSALATHGQPLVALTPQDVGRWCPAYPQASDADRRAFWVAFLSALAKHESTYRARAVGGGGKWFGLLQISPGTARSYGCRARTGQALREGAANLSCAIRIMARTVTRDGVIHGYRGGKGQGVTADWGPMHSKSKRQDIAGWLKQQRYCKPLDATRPKKRP